MKTANIEPFDTDKEMITLHFGEHFIIERRSKGEKKGSRTHRTAVTGLAVILAAMLCVGCGKAEQTPAASAQPSAAAETTAPSEPPEASSVPASAAAATAVPETSEPEQSSAPTPLSAQEQYLADAQAYFDAGDYYRAYDAAMRSQSEADTEVYARSEELIEQIRDAVAANEPENSEELERTFSVSGGGQLRVSAQSGPLEMLVTDNDDPKRFVRFYVRHGETGSVYLPSGSYTVTCKLGFIWFDDETGFGEYYDYLALEDPLVFEFNMTGGWISNSTWSLTI